MPKHIAKLNKFGGQYRLTIPRLLVEECGWHDVEFVILYPLQSGSIEIGRFVDGESLKAKDARDRPGSD